MIPDAVTHAHVVLLRLGQVCCVYCGDTTQKRHREHVIPQRRGGTDHYLNIVMACPACNHAKAAKRPSEWRDDLRAEIYVLEWFIAAEFPEKDVAALRLYVMLSPEQIRRIDGLWSEARSHKLRQLIEWGLAAFERGDVVLPPTPRKPKPHRIGQALAETRAANARRRTA